MNTIATERIDALVKQAAQANLSSQVVKSVFSEATVDSEGEAALRVTIVVTPESVRKISGDTLIDTLVQIQRDLQSAGEDRFAIVEYATPADLEDAGSES